MRKTAERRLENNLHRIVNAGEASHRGFTYFVVGEPDIGYHLELMNAAGEILCASERFGKHDECVKVLRQAQRHAATKHVIDDSVHVK